MVCMARKLKEEYGKWGRHKFRKKKCTHGRGKKKFQIGRCGISKTTYRMYLFRHKNNQLGDNTTEIKHRISQKRKAINALNSI